MSRSRKAPDWMCPNCNYMVFGSKKSCKKCGAENPSNSKPKEKGSKAPDWMCPNCNFTVFGSKKSCKKCGAENPANSKPKESKSSKSSKAPDWTCPNCNFTVFGSKKSCKKCGAKNPFKSENKKNTKNKKENNEWNCSSCNTSNYNDRDKCRKCGNSKAEKKESDNEMDLDEKEGETESKISINVNINAQLEFLMKNEELNIDIVFIMDCTASMSPYINAAKTKIKDIMSDLLKDKNVKNINFGYIAYRDHPKSDNSLITKCFPLTNNVEQMEKYIASYGAQGGGDGPECLTEALHDSISKIKYNDDHIKINVLICDAPGHGWGCTNYDNYEGGNPNGHDPIQICHEMSKRGIILYVLGCYPSLSYYKGAVDILTGMCKITEGFFLPLTNADLVAQLIVQSVKQEVNLSFIEKYIIDMLIELRQKNKDIQDENELLKKLNLDEIKKLKINDKLELSNVYDGKYDNSNVDVIVEKTKDPKNRNIHWIKKNIDTNIKQPGVKKFVSKSKFDMKSGDWNCNDCHYHNFANRWYCRNCKTGVNHTLKDGDWLCTACDDINFAKNKFCRKCKKVEKPKGGKNIMIRKKDDSKEELQEVTGVNCDVNDSIVSVLLNRIKKQNKFHDWKCGCGYINFENRDVCRKCGIEKKDNFGDWKCSCGYMNFGSRKVCRDCDKKKPQ